MIGVFAALAAGLLAGYGIALPVGAVGTYLVGLAARAPFRIAVAAALGVATADGGYALLAALGGGPIADAVRAVAGPLRIGSAVVLAALAAVTAVRALREHAAPVPPEVRVPSAVRAYAGLLAVTCANPTTVVYFAALVVASRSAVAATPADRLAFALAALVASASWQVALVTCGSLLGRVVAGRRARLATALVSSAVVLALAARLLA